MSEVRKVSIALTEEQIEALKAVVATGEHTRTSEVVREAIRDWQFKRELRQKDIERLRQLWDEGKASGPLKPAAKIPLISASGRHIAVGTAPIFYGAAENGRRNHSHFLPNPS